MLHRRNRRRDHGFTLIEVLLVLVILVVLASFAVVQFRGIQQRAKLDTAKTQVGLCETALEHFQLSIGNYPTQAQGLPALRSRPQDLPDPSKWDGPYLQRDVPLDPWGNPYQYAIPGGHNRDGFDVWSFGPDGTNATPDDIGNWTQEVAR
jgi:general secretion pathway protein G